jgi:TRAP-type uncharacterized transport system substrate-binding protein
MSDSDMSSAISDRIIDIGFGLGTYPKSSIQEIEKSPGIRMVPFGDDLRKYLAVNRGGAFSKSRQTHMQAKRRIPDRNLVGRHDSSQFHE